MTEREGDGGGNGAVTPLLVVRGVVSASIIILTAFHYCSLCFSFWEIAHHSTAGAVPLPFTLLHHLYLL